MSPASLSPLVVMNLVLAAAFLAAALAIAVAVFLDVRERRRWKALVPDCWPPPGVEPQDAYADDEPATSRTSADHPSVETGTERDR